MPDTPNYTWNMPTVGADLDTWGDELNATTILIDAEMFKKADKANPVFTGSISAPVFIGTPSAILRPTVDSATAIQLQNAAGTAIVTVDTTSNQLIAGDGGIKAGILLGTPQAVIRTGPGGVVISFQNSTGAQSAAIDTANHIVSAGAGGMNSPAYRGSPVVLAPTVDAASAIQFHGSTPGNVKGYINTLTGSLNMSGSIVSEAGQYYGSPTVSLIPISDGTQAIRFVSGSGPVRASIDTVNGRMAIGPSAPVAGATLELQGVTGGLTLNRMTTAQRDAISAQVGTILFDTTLGKVIYMSPVGWDFV